jgi:hypothetical protein
MIPPTSDEEASLMEVIDQYDDLGERFSRSGPVRESASLLKQASWIERDDLLDRDFALILVDDTGKEHRKFACYDAGSTLVSQWYLTHASSGLPAAAMKVASANLMEAAKFHGAPASLTMFKAASAPEQGADERRVYVPSVSAPSLTEPSHIRKTASAFDVISKVASAWADMDPYDRHDAAVDLLVVAADCGADIPPEIFQYSGTTLNPRFQKIAEARAQFTSDAEIQSGYLRISKMAAAMEPDDVVESVFLLDEQAGLTGRYGARLPDPLLAVYGTEKAAEYSWLQGGDYVTERMLKSYSGSTAFNTAGGQVFTEEVCRRFKADPVATFKAMPAVQQKIMARLASQSRDSNDGGN